MRLRDTRLWAMLLALAFIVLWCVSISVAYAAPSQEPLTEPVPATAERLHVIGVWGWALVGVGFTGVVGAVVLSSRAHRRPRRGTGKYAAAQKVSRSPRPDRVVYAAAPKRRYQRNVERRY